MLLCAPSHPLPLIETARKGKVSRMTSTQALQLAREARETGKAEPLIKLLYFFKTSRGDPLDEAVMSTVLKTLYLETEHCEAGLAQFVGESEPQENESSLAA